MDNLPQTKTPIMLNVASPDLAFKFAQIPNAGVGLAREEFIINNYIQAHPLALLKHKELEDEEKLRWKWINILLPFILVVGFGFIRLKRENSRAKVLEEIYD